jgi:hypothetical protein
VFNEREAIVEALALRPPLPPQQKEENTTPQQ